MSAARTLVRLSLPAMGLAALLACGDTETPPPAEAPAPAEAGGQEVPDGLEAFAPQGAAFRTALPPGAATDGGCEASGCAWRIGLADEAGAPRVDASIHLVFPSDAETVDDLVATHVDGDGGVFAAHPDWVRTGTLDGNPAQPWMVKAISYEDGDTEVGRVLVGESPRGPFLVVERIAKDDLNTVRPILASAYTHLELLPAP